MQITSLALGCEGEGLEGTGPPGVGPPLGPAEPELVGAPPEEATGAPLPATPPPLTPPGAPLLLIRGTATWSGGHTEATQEAAVDAKGAFDAVGGDVGPIGDGEGDVGEPPATGAPPPGAPPLDDELLEPPLSTWGAPPMPLAPFAPAEGGVTLR